MQTDDFVRRWPFCYHVTFTPNIARIREAGMLYAAQTLLRSAGHPALRHRREADMTIRIDDRSVVLRNQRALDPCALALPADCSLGDYIAFLNERAYFWPGTASGPVDDALRLWASHAAGDPPAVVRVPSLWLVDANGDAALQVADCNTGASWMEGGRKAYRAPRRCRHVVDFSGDPEAVNEVSFRHAVRLPRSTQVAASCRGGWVAL